MAFSGARHGILIMVLGGAATASLGGGCGGETDSVATGSGGQAGSGQGGEGQG
ncbi:MAG: hypothetical protein HUU21_32940, partial [Polyangiaceae bacterium]|nr:hypothetical protein [Polyangiaceae bacterium]